MSARFRLVVLVLVAIVAAAAWLTNPAMPWSDYLFPGSGVFWVAHALVTGASTIGTLTTYLWYKEKAGRYRP